jgi:hypothetical protein
MYSIECQIIEGGTGDFIVVGDGSYCLRRDEYRSNLKVLKYVSKG